MMVEKEVQILLATYNGGKYLREQIESLLCQDYQRFSILIRDDGSEDNTREILENYSKNEKVKKIIYGRNIGVINNFFELLKKSDSNCEYFAFCDQDDVWLESKLSRAIDKLSKYNPKEINLYCSNKTVVNQNLIKIGSDWNNRLVKPSFYNSLVENIATGCTIVINRTMRDALLRHIPNNIVMHDWWMYLFASGIGNVNYDDQSYILYRQHESNVIGVSGNFFGKWFRRIRYLKKNHQNYLSILRNNAIQAQEILYEDLCPQKREVVQKIINLPQNLILRAVYALKMPLYRQSLLDNIVLKALLTFGKLEIK